MSAAKVAAITSACDWVMVPSSTSRASFSSSALYARVSSTAVESSSVVLRRQGNARHAEGGNHQDGDPDLERLLHRTLLLGFSNSDSLKSNYRGGVFEDDEGRLTRGWEVSKRRLRGGAPSTDSTRLSKLLVNPACCRAALTLVLGVRTA